MPAKASSLSELWESLRDYKTLVPYFYPSPYKARSGGGR